MANPSAGKSVILALLLTGLLGPALGCRSGSGADPGRYPDPGGERRETHEQLNAVLWIQTSAEYGAVCRTLYRAAETSLELALADPSWTAALEQQGDFQDLPPAVILDVDETVLDSSDFEGSLIQARLGHDDRLWQRWKERAAARPVPGALDFVRGAARRGVEVYFITNRDVSAEPLTRRNLEAAGFLEAGAPDVILSRHERPEWTADKTGRRAFVAAGHRVLLLIGDNLADFLEDAPPTPPERKIEGEAHSARWGVRWFMLPNPLYGHWEKALTGHAPGATDEEILKIKMEAVRGFDR